MKAIVEKRLAAAGLCSGKCNPAPEPLENPRDCDSDLRIELVGQTGDEKRDIVKRHASGFNLWPSCV
jgi:hypothetical protein